MYHFKPDQRTKIAQLINQLEDRVSEIKEKLDHAYSLPAYKGYKWQLIKETEELQTIKNYYNETAKTNF